MIRAAALLLTCAATLRAQGAPPRPDSARADSARALRAAVITTTRAERRVEDTPIRVEVVDEEEVAEKAAMTPGDITMMLNETPGLRVQTTSPALGGAGVRIQGMRARYTLLLADGLPLYGGQAGGFGLLQIPPIDLAGAEVIKGSASALYGAAALGGVINLRSRRPDDEPVRELLLNATSRGGTDLVSFLSRRLSDESHWGTTLLASAHSQPRADIDGDGWTDLATYSRAVVRPRLFFDNRAGRTFFATAGATIEERAGGTMPGRLAPDGFAFAEGLGTARFDAGVSARALTDGGNFVATRASFTEQRHRHRIGTVLERDAHRTGFGEVALTLPRGALTTVVGAGFQWESYGGRDVTGFDFTHSAPSLFVQLDRDAAPWLVLSASGRADQHSEFGTLMSPRLSALVRGTTGRLAGWNARLSVGGGAFAPTALTEETEASGLTPLRPLPALDVERALGASLDIGGLITLGDERRIELNASLFTNQVADALAAVDDAGTTAGGARFLRLANAPVATRTAGAEVMARIVAGDARLTASYGYADASEWNPLTASGRRDVALVPRHTAGIVGAIEREGTGRLGVEFYYVGVQPLDDDPYRSESRAHLVIGVLAEKIIGRARWFINAENLLDERQTRYDPLLLGERGRGGRWTTDVWAPLDGRTFNAGVRFGL